MIITHFKNEYKSFVMNCFELRSPMVLNYKIVDYFLQVKFSLMDRKATDTAFDKEESSNSNQQNNEVALVISLTALIYVFNL